MVLYEVLPKVFITGSRHNDTQTGDAGSLGRYGKARPMPPPENRTYIKESGTSREAAETDLPPAPGRSI
jgi:hypothetical protein